MGCGCRKNRHEQGQPVTIDNGFSAIPNVTKIRCSSQEVTDDCEVDFVEETRNCGCRRRRRCCNHCNRCGCNGFGGFGLFW